MSQKPQKPLDSVDRDIPVDSSEEQSLPEKQTVVDASTVNAPEVEKEEEVVVVASDRESVESDLEGKTETVELKRLVHPHPLHITICHPLSRTFLQTASTTMNTICVRLLLLLIMR